MRSWRRFHNTNCSGAVAMETVHRPWQPTEHIDFTYRRNILQPYSQSRRGERRNGRGWRSGNIAKCPIYFDGPLLRLTLIFLIRLRGDHLDETVS